MLWAGGGARGPPQAAAATAAGLRGLRGPDSDWRGSLRDQGVLQLSQRVAGVRSTDTLHGLRCANAVCEQEARRSPAIRPSRTLTHARLTSHPPTLLQVVVISDPQALLMTGPELTTAASEKLPLLIIVPVGALDAQRATSADGVAPAPFLFGAFLDLAAFAASFGFPYFLQADGADATLPAAESTLRAALAAQASAQTSCVIVEWRTAQSSSVPEPTALVATPSLLPSVSASKREPPAAEVAQLSSRLVADLTDASVGLLVASPWSHGLLALMDTMSASATQAGSHCELQVLFATDDQSSGFVADGFARRNREGRLTQSGEVKDGLISALIVDGDAPPACFSGVGEALMDCTPLLVLVLESESAATTRTTSDAEPAEPAAMAVARVLCKQEFDTAARGSIVAAATAARAGRPGPVAVYVRRAPPSTKPLASVEVPPGSAPTVLDPEQLEAVEAVAAALRGASQPRLHLGIGAARAADLALELAELLGCARHRV